MKITFSPLIAAASGKAADAVASSWHGRAFVRKLVIPKNPRSALQTAQRAKLSRIPVWWRSLPDSIKGSPAMRAAGTYGLLEIIAKAYNLPAYSVFGRYNLQALSDDEAPPLTPGNPSADEVASCVPVAGASTKLINVSWDAGSALGTHFVHPFTIPLDAFEVGKLEPDMITYHADKKVTVVTGAIVGLPCLTAAKQYFVILLVANNTLLTAATALSGGVGAIGTSLA